MLEMPLAAGKRKSLVFSAEGKAGRNEIVFKLKNKKGEKPEIKLKLSRRILKNSGAAFLEAIKEGEEFYLGAGLGFSW